MATAEAKSLQSCCLRDPPRKQTSRQLQSARGTRKKVSCRLKRDLLPRLVVSCARSRDDASSQRQMLAAKHDRDAWVERHERLSEATGLHVRYSRHTKDDYWQETNVLRGYWNCDFLSLSGEVSLVLNLNVFQVSDQTSATRYAKTSLALFCIYLSRPSLSQVVVLICY